MEFELDIPKKQFKEHLAIPNNQRIIFSGAFGTGKTYFLNRYFEKHEQYEAIHIYPVNYSVASNEDIFELIKYDILFKLLEKGLDFGEVKIDKGTFLPFFLKNHATEIIPSLLGVIPKVGGSMKDIAKGLIDLNNRFEKEFKEANLTNKDRIISYLETFSKNQGSIKEEDFFTQLICGLVGQLKEKGKEIVLIIDDLDRIDPEHIFRIMNVLAAHVDIKKDSDQNKFDFDKIILVCDIENIRKIFSNRYGADVDFSGYIDKFYSRSLFHYDLSGEVVKNIDSVFQSVIINNGRSEMRLAEYRNDGSTIIIKYIILACLQYNLIPIRVLKRILSGSSALKSRRFWKEGDGKSIDSEEIELIKVVDFLSYLFQGYQSLVSKLDFLIGRDIKNPMTTSRSFLVEEWLKAACFKEYASFVDRTSLKDITERELEIKGMKFKFSISRIGMKQDHWKDFYDFRIQSICIPEKVNVRIDSLDFFELLTWLLRESDFKQLFNERALY
ncbi:P-loop NTPase fold protein [Pleomorphovibrio marinus]|uniref:P-loop NTPase fold protein n=1 Tax=Pleomorphovibrio marinus TaxID=2164132 RepID=UPI000E0BF940|nr:P-loop NTPase fold protein [Pleomorphovibrio marinus]